MRVAAIALACLLVAVDASAQVSGGVARPADYKDPTTATLLSVVIPGGGQFYAGETGKGAAILGATTGGFALAAASSCPS